MKKSNVKKQALCLLIALWGVVSFAFLCGEPNEDATISLTTIAIIKLAALGSLWLCGKTAVAATKRGLMPWEIK